jgi:hypothetical protein
MRPSEATVDTIDRSERALRSAEGLRDHVEDDQEHQRDVDARHEQDPPQPRLDLRRPGPVLGRGPLEPLRLRPEWSPLSVE